MNKVAFLVENAFDFNHFGVRNYFSTLKNILNRDSIVEFISYKMGMNGTKWYKVYVEDTAQQRIEDRELVLNKLSTISLEHIQKHLSQLPSVKKKYHYQYIGSSLENEKYDLCIITNPWCVNNYVKIHAKRIVGLVYDLIPNVYTFTKSQKDFTWGGMHNVGYKYYNKYCDEIITINVAVAEQYKNLYPHVPKNKVSYLKPFVTLGFENADIKDIEKENAIMLAAPFDLRKGLLSLPAMINKLEDLLEKVYIFGVPRCSQKEFQEFFKKVNCDKIVYYPKISQEKLISLYSKSKFLLFPSLDEGLGLPLLEAQICGCRVVTTNKEPMNKLGLNGSYLLANILDQDIEIMRHMLNDSDFDYNKLSEVAKNKFLYDGIAEQVLGE